MRTLTLRWQHNGHAHERTLAQGEKAIIGRDAACEIVLPADDRTIHRRHAEITWEAGTPRLKALGQNGVTVDSLGRKLGKDESTRMAATDRLTIGETQIDAQSASGARGARKLRCHNCDRVQDYAPEGMCIHCGFALAGGETVFIQE